MAESIVSLVINRISGLLILEAGSLYGVKEEVERLQAELKRMQCFLKDIDVKQDQDERVRNWVAEIRDVTYDAEDVIDTFILKVKRRERRYGIGSGGTIKKFAFIVTKAFHLHKIVTQIKSIRTRIVDISNGLQSYGIKFAGEGEGSNSRSEMQRRLRRSYPHSKEEDVIILEDSKRDLMAHLMMQDERLRVVSVVGMGGLGKTTLAKQVYNHIDVKQRFDCHAWVFISQQYAIKDVLFEILSKVTSSFQEDRERLREEDLVERLYNVLTEKRYLVVLDDIWRIETWDSLKPAFPNGRKGSKVLMTTRIKDVASYADPWSSPIEPPFLTIEEGWELLTRKAFPRDIVGQHGCTPEFQKLGKEIVGKCGGLPLAIVVLGGLLATKKSLYEWEVVQRNIIANLKKFQQHHYGGVYGILALSYHDLPYHLKPCFLSFANFPEDWEIRKKRLIRRWIAEGFIPPQLEGEGEETMEDVAEQYLEELINRCMVQMGGRDHTGRSVKTCRIHDLMRDLCVLKAREENFLGIIEQEGSFTSTSTSSNMHSTTVRTRRIAIHVHKTPCNYSYSKLLVQGHPHIRSLSFFIKGSEDRLTPLEEDFMCKNFKLLRVLDLEKVFIFSRPRRIGNLIHLRYLILKGRRTLSLPESIVNLRSLHTLDLRGITSAWLPNALGKLECLRHLLVDVSVDGPFRIDSLRNLETLKHIKAKYLIKNDAMLKLTNLRNLKVHFESSEEAEAVLKSPIFGLCRLRSLRMDISLQSSFQDFEPLSRCHRLSKLELNGVISDDLRSNLHNLECLHANLVKLALRNSHIKQHLMSMLEKLPNLRFLWLRFHSYVGSEMVCSAHGFPQLEVFKLERLEELEEWRIEEGAMPCLKSLCIERLHKFRMIPEGLKFVTTLQELTIRCMTKKFNNRLQVVDGVEGEDFNKVRHIPSVCFYN